MEPYTAKYEHKSGSELRFALGFRDEGAKLKLHIKSPDNKDFIETYTSTAILRIPDAKTGTWTYSVTPVTLPYPEFPFCVRVSGKN